MPRSRTLQALSRATTPAAEGFCSTPILPFPQEPLIARDGRHLAERRRLSPRRGKETEQAHKPNAGSGNGIMPGALPSNSASSQEAGR
jgi:hypothetical protein